jgi:negative regulator of sigma E activity
MSRNVFDDSRDDALRKALRAAVPEPPLDDVDWDALHARITAAAQPHVRGARPRQRQAPVGGAAAPWWTPLAGWSARGIPLAAAATVLLVIGAGVIGTRPQTAQAPAEDVAFRTLEEELVSGVSAGSRPLLAGVEAESMLDAALFYEGEDW